MKKITAKISLTKQDWSLLILLMDQAVPILPIKCWEVSKSIREEIEKGLENAEEEN